MTDRRTDRRTDNNSDNNSSAGFIIRCKNVFDLPPGVKFLAEKNKIKNAYTMYIHEYICIKTIRTIGKTQVHV